LRKREVAIASLVAADQVRGLARRAHPPFFGAGRFQLLDLSVKQQLGTPVPLTR